MPPKAANFLGDGGLGQEGGQFFGPPEGGRDFGPQDRGIPPPPPPVPMSDCALIRHIHILCVVANNKAFINYSHTPLPE